MASWRLADDCAQLGLVRTRAQRHRARRCARLVWRGHRLACGEIHPPGLSRDLEGERPEPADVADPDTETPNNRPGVSEEEDGFANDAEEEMEDLPMEEKGKDPLLYATVKVCIGGEEHIGYVEDIEVGRITRERLYLVKYADGDEQHMTEQEVKRVRTFEDLGPGSDDSGTDDSDDESDAAYHDALADEDEGKHELGPLLAEVRRAAFETIAGVDVRREFITEDFFHCVLDEWPWIERRAKGRLEQMVVNQAIRQALCEAVGAGRVVKRGETRKDGPLYGRRPK